MIVTIAHDEISPTDPQADHLRATQGREMLAGCGSVDAPAWRWSRGGWPDESLLRDRVTSGQGRLHDQFEVRRRGVKAGFGFVPIRFLHGPDAFNGRAIRDHRFRGAFAAKEKT